MDEKKLQKQLIRITAITVLSSIILTLIGFGIWGYTVKSAYEVKQERLKMEAVEYKVRVLKQMDKNIQILTTLSKAYEVSTITDDPERLEKSLMATNSANDFISMIYMDKSGVGIMHTPNFGTWNDITLEKCNEYSAEAIESALQGENAVSKVFESKVYDGKLFVYAVPVYKNNEVVGALAASDTLDIFKDISNGNVIMNGSGYIHLINSKGEFLVRSPNTIVKEIYDTIYGGRILSGETQERIASALKRGVSTSGEYTYLGEKCHFYIEPLGINGWFLFCSNRLSESTFFATNILTAFGIIMIVFVVIVNILLYSGHHAFTKNTKSLIKIAYSDPLTNAENIVKFDENFQELQPEQKNNFSTVAINVHNFKAINDLFGKSRGDLVLLYIKRVIDENLKDGEFFCRDTADLFYITMFDTDENIITKRVRCIIDHISKASLDYGEYSYELSLYAGVAIGGDREKALVAMQSIKNTHHTDIAFYNHNMHDALRRKNSIESQMYPALQNREFKLFLQPKFDIKNNRLIGAEALVRWQNLNGSYRYPNEFIPLFEENGFCIKLDMYMVERACEQIKEWIDSGITPIPISVNQSKLLFSDFNYPENLMHILDKYNVSPSLITLEILEGVANNNLERLNQQINALHEKGFKISMDDFGSGYSSLNMLYQLKIDELKLDRGFMRKAAKEDEERRKVILEQIISFAHKLDITTVAEGIEVQEDKDMMLSLNCDFGQGYFYDKPMCAKEFSEKYMENNHI